MQVYTGHRRAPQGGGSVCWYPEEEEASNCSLRWLDLIRKGQGGRAKTWGVGEWLV